jgi:hypothetical protein
MVGREEIVRCQLNLHYEFILNKQAFKMPLGSAAITNGANTVAIIT